MPYTPPWIVPADVIRSASAGASAGLSARAHDLQAAAQQQAAEEFIARLNQQASEFSQNLASQHDIATSRLAQALRAQDALDVYRKGELDVRNKDRQSREGIASDRFAAEMLRQDALDDYRNRELSDREAGRKATKDYRDARLKQFQQGLDSPSKLFQNNPESIIARGEFNEAVKGSDADKLKAAEDALRRTLSPPGTYVPVVSGGAPDTRSTMEKFLPNFIGGKAAPDPATTNWVRAMQPTNAPAAMAPAEKVVVVKDGKRYRLPKSELDEAERSGYQLER